MLLRALTVRRVLFAFVVVAAFGILGNQSARATPACPENVQESFSAIAPKQVAFNYLYKSQLRFYVQRARPWLPAETFHVSGPWGWAQKLRGWSDEDETPTYGEDGWGFFWWKLPKTWLTERHRTGRMVLSASFKNRATSERCYVKRQIGVTKGIPGSPMSATFDRYRDPEAGGSLNLNCPGVPARELSSEPVRILLKSREGFRGYRYWWTRSLTLRNPCIRSQRPVTLQNGQWSLKPYYWSGVDGFLSLGWKGRSRRYLPLRLRVLQGNRLLLGINFRIRWVNRPSRTIWIGTDAFVNYCINKLKTIYSKNGRLYCRTDNRSGYRVRTQRLG